jgi:hypothetical protein
MGIRRSLELATATTIAMLVCVNPLEAHHSARMFEFTTPIWVEGTFVKFARINPHSVVTVEETTKDGQVREWLVEGPDLFGLERRGIYENFFKAGDVVKFCAFPLKPEFANPSRDYTSPPFVHGHAVMMPDGKVSMWGSYGALSECIRSAGDDERAAWLDTLNSNPRIREVWCEQRKRTMQQTQPWKSLVDEISGQMAAPCE